MSQSEQNVVVLVADDEPSTLALVASHVRSKGYKVLEASDGDQAWQLAHEHLPDLVILDVMMPGMSGWELCHKIRETVSLAHTGVIMLTGIGENLNEMTSPLYGADAYLDKPFEFSVLDERVAETLARRRQGTMGRPAETVDATPAHGGHHNGAASVEAAAELHEHRARSEKPAPKRAPANVAAPSAPEERVAARKGPAPKPKTTRKAKPAASSRKAKPAARPAAKGKQAAAKKKARPAAVKAKPAAAKKAATKKPAAKKKTGAKQVSAKKAGNRAGKRAAAKTGKRNGPSRKVARRAAKPAAAAPKKAAVVTAKKPATQPTKKTPTGTAAREPKKSPAARAKSEASGGATV